MTYKILIAGPQGSGKGTQAERLAVKLGIPALSMGQLLRDEVAAGTELGNRMKAAVEGGGLVPESIAAEILKGRLAKPDVTGGYILDGYPRSLGQLSYFTFDTPTHVIVLDVPREESLRRLTHRLTCTKCGAVANELDGRVKGDTCACGGLFEKRKDDVPEAIERRLGIYANETTPVLNEFGKRGSLRHVDGVGSIPLVTERIEKELGL